jgi:ribosome-associated toxin RatA of RatAB toxin-antitoxin module
MPTVTAQTEIAAARIERVWDIVSDVERYPSLAAHVLEVSPDGAHHRWAVLLNGSRVGWVQRDCPSPPRQLRFEQVTGDLDQLRGRWALEQRGTSVRLCLRICAHLGVDGLAPLLDPIWAQSFQAHADALVRAIAAASSPAETASSPAETRTT